MPRRLAINSVSGTQTQNSLPLSSTLPASISGEALFQVVFVTSVGGRSLAYSICPTAQHLPRKPEIGKALPASDCLERSASSHYMKAIQGPRDTSGLWFRGKHSLFDQLRIAFP